jgi:hypothetical protein
MTGTLSLINLALLMSLSTLLTILLGLGRLGFLMSALLVSLGMFLAALLKAGTFAGTYTCVELFVFFAVTEAERIGLVHATTNIKSISGRFVTILDSNATGVMTMLTGLDLDDGVFTTRLFK